MGVVREAYEQKVAAGELHLDEAQAAALSELDRIARQMTERPERKGLGGFFAKKPPPIGGL